MHAVCQPHRRDAAVPSRAQDFLDAISTTRCDDELARFYACKANRRKLAADGVEREQLPSCATLELAALSCLGHKVLKRMSTSRGLSTPLEGRGSSVAGP